MPQLFPGFGEFEGEVVDFDGELYKISYQDGDEELVGASGFDNMTIAYDPRYPNGMPHPASAGGQSKGKVETRASSYSGERRKRGRNELEMKHVGIEAEGSATTSRDRKCSRRASRDS